VVIGDLGPVHCKYSKKQILDLYTASIPRSRSWTCTLQVFQEANRDQELVALSDSGTGYPAPVPEEFPHHTGYSFAGRNSVTTSGSYSYDCNVLTLAAINCMEVTTIFAQC
jgi:hypothetical protein